MSLGIHACDVHAPKETQFGSLTLSHEEKEAGRRGGGGSGGRGQDGAPGLQVMSWDYGRGIHHL